MNHDTHAKCPKCGQVYTLDPAPQNVSELDVSTSHEPRDTEAEQQQMIDAFKAAVAAIMGNPPPEHEREYQETQQRREQELHDAFTAAVQSIVGENR